LANVTLVAIVFEENSPLRSLLFIRFPDVLFHYSDRLIEPPWIAAKPLQFARGKPPSGILHWFPERFKCPVRISTGKKYRGIPRIREASFTPTHPGNASAE